ncbi:Quinol oxidase subunit 1 [Paenibacillus sp. CECT 9249]|nr:Quinol oxidase subunit 1 [Paenibacillus sp. CECT 9249]
MPQYVLGLMGMTRRLVTYGWDKGWWEMNLVSTIGAALMGLAFLFQVWQIAYSVKHLQKDETGDPWNGRTLEWSLPSPAPHYNFATLPQVSSQDEWWEEKQRRKSGQFSPAPVKLEPIHMPKNSGIPFVMSMFWFAAGFGFVFDWLWLTISGLAGVAVCMLVHSFNYDTDYYIPVKEIKRTEGVTGEWLH